MGSGWFPEGFVAAGTVTGTTNQPESTSTTGLGPNDDSAAKMTTETGKHSASTSVTVVHKS